ncbi:isochorismatase family protein [bacterium 3DAC]|jgi:nicotinamidase-related amidase|nr:isochorismatase family protein [bacterium 3DAC]
MIREGYLSEDVIPQLVDVLSPYAGKRDPYWVSQKLALVVMNPINFFYDKAMQGYVPSTTYLVDVLPMLIQKANEAGMPVFYVRHGVERGREGSIGRWWRYPVYEDSKDSMLYPLFAELPGVEFIKHRYSAFSSEAFSSALKMYDVGGLILTGVLLDLSVLSTALDAFDRDYSVVVPIDGVATLTYDLHVSTMKIIAHGVGFIPTVEEVISAI